MGGYLCSCFYPEGAGNANDLPSSRRKNHEVDATQAQITAALEQLEQIKQEVLKLQKNVDKGSNENKNLIYLRDMLNHSLRQLDAVEHDLHKDISIAKQEIIKNIRSTLTKLDMYASTFENPPK